MRHVAGGVIGQGAGGTRRLRTVPSPALRLGVIDFKVTVDTRKNML